MLFYHVLLSIKCLEGSTYFTHSTWATELIVRKTEAQRGLPTHQTRIIKVELYKQKKKSSKSKLI